jgi:hypothetical protein
MTRNLILFGKRPNSILSRIFSLLLIGLTFFGCEIFEPEVIPKNGTWEWKSTGEYIDEIDFYIYNGKIIQPASDTWRSLRFTMKFDNWSITSSTDATIEIEDGNFKYETGSLSSGKTTIEGEFTSATTCEGKVNYERKSITIDANGSL